MSSSRRALITGITGQDGSYLAELLLAKGYEVFGLIRRSSAGDTNLGRIEHLLPDKITLISGDLLDSSSLVRAIKEAQPQEVYNLAAQSYVQDSFQQPLLTSEITGLGAARLLEVIRENDPSIRFYQASSSEMFGNAPHSPQDELTPLVPRSPYGVAKLYAHMMTRNYREAYDLFACSGILFNHESVPAETPVVVRKHGLIDIEYIGDIVPHRTKPNIKRYSSNGGDYEVWDGQKWVKCLARTAYWHEGTSVTLHGRGGIVTSTPDHVIFTPEGEQPAKTLGAGDHLQLAEQPPAPNSVVVSEDEAWLLGILTAEGYVSPQGSARITCGDEAVLKRAAQAWRKVAAGFSRRSSGTPSRFDSTRRTPTLELRGNAAYLRMLRAELYTEAGKKRVPRRILNAAPSTQEIYLSAYNAGDGLKAGRGTDEFKSWRTTSALLATGLIWLARTALGRKVSVYEQPGALGGGSSYLINLTSGGSHGLKGAHLRKLPSEIRKTEVSDFSGWMFDIATESERFAAGVGLVTVHNSPRRTLHFVTRKITDGVARIATGKADRLELGNLEALRDWGFAGDYVEAMWMMLQAATPSDYVVATGESHSVRDFCAAAFGAVGLDYRDYVVSTAANMRPSELHSLKGNAARVRAELGWAPKTDFDGLVAMMVEADLRRHRGE